MPAEGDKKTRTGRRTKVVALTAGLVLVGGAAFAWWTTGGSGTGTASTGDVANVTVVQTSSITGLAPGGAPQTLSGTFTNPNSGPVYVGTVTVSISSVVKAPGAVAGTCDSSDYALGSNPLVYNAEVLADDSSTWSGPTIAFVNKATNQDQCKGATVNLAYSIS